MSPNAPIAVIDSGLSGLAVVRALRAALPREEIVYLGDTARGGIGTNSAERIEEFVSDAIRWVARLDPKQVVIACHTMAAVGVAARREFHELSISTILEPSAKSAVEACGSKEMPIIGVLASEATIRSKAYERAVHRRRHHARLLLRPTPLVEAVVGEGRDCNDSLVRLMMRQYVQPVITRGADVLVLACNHFTLLADAVRRVVPEDVRIVDAPACTAQDVARRLQAAGLLRSGVDSNEADRLRICLTDELPRYSALASRFLGFEAPRPTVVALDALVRRDPLPICVPA
jgi:glutamate racemase